LIFKHNANDNAIILALVQITICARFSSIYSPRGLLVGLADVTIAGRVLSVSTAAVVVFGAVSVLVVVATIATKTVRKWGRAVAEHQVTYLFE